MFGPIAPFAKPTGTPNSALLPAIPKVRPTPPIAPIPEVRPELMEALEQAQMPVAIENKSGRVDQQMQPTPKLDAPSDSNMALADALRANTPTEYRSIFDGINMLVAPMLAAQIEKEEESKRQAQAESSQQALMDALAGAGATPEAMQAAAVDEDLARAMLAQAMAPPETLSPYQEGQLAIDRERLELARQEANRPREGRVDPLVEVYDPNSPTGTSLVPRSEAAGKPGKPPSSALSITGYDDQGRPIMQVGGRQLPGQDGNIPLGRSSQTETEKEAIDLTEARARVGRIRQTFRPEFQTIGGKIGNKWSAFKDKLGMPLSEDEKTTLAEFTTARATAYGDLNETLRAISGAAVTPQEAERLLLQIPDPGTGPFAGDSPTEFEAKLAERERAITLAFARKAYIALKGIPFDFNSGSEPPVSIEQMPGIIDDMGAEFEREALAAGMSREEAEEEAMRLVGETLGI